MGAFATRRIMKGAIILEEKPFFIIRKPHQAILDEDIWSAFQKLVPSGKRQFLDLRDNGSRPFICMSDAFAENSFAITSSVLSGTYGRLAHGLFLLHSRFNHSCIPNSKLPDTGKEIVTSFATRDIAEGEEITFCCNSDFECRTMRDRHQQLRFNCNCKACYTGTPFQQLSDMRRILIRGLQYLTHGIDIDGQRHLSASPIILDSSLKHAAEEFNISLSPQG